MALKTLPERRKILRVDMERRVEVDVLPSELRLEANSVNLSEGGICLRLQRAVEISAEVRLRLFADASKRPVECGGRIAWVVQRLDLRDAPPFLYDVGVEFVDPPTSFRQFVSQVGVAVKPSAVRSSKQALLHPAIIRNRCYTPRIDHETSSNGKWHLVVTVDGVPCFSRRYTLEREAFDGWQRFKRQVGVSSSRTAG